MFKNISEGDVYLEPTAEYNYAVPRTAIIPDGNILCCFGRTKGLGINDFTTMCAYSADGEKWSEATVVWPEYEGKKATVMTPRTMPDGRVSLSGMIFDVEYDGELWWSNELGSMKKNKLCWCISPDGRKIPLPYEVELPDAASCEQPGGMLVRENGEMLILYSPCATIDPKGPVVTSRQVLMRSRDGGNSFHPQEFGQLEPPVMYAESWIVELDADRLLSGTWITGNEPFPDAYFVSSDSGETFNGPFEMPFKGQTTSLTPYGDNMVLIPYNQRQHGTVGVWLALVKIEGTGMRLLENQPVWEAQTTTKKNKSADFVNFTDYAFGEPQVTVMHDGSLLVVFWYDQPYGTGIHYVKVRKL